MPTFRLAHLSDPHLAPPPQRASLRDLMSKRLLSRISWRRKRARAHRPDVLAAIVADMARQAPDHIVITGDLTNFSAPEEFAAARLWLETLGDARDVTVSPGNHDALVARGGGERFATWAPWFGDRGEVAFPQVRVRGGVAIVNLCSARPTAPLLAQGALGAGQIAQAAAILEALGGQGLFRVVLVHHPITAGVVSGRKALTDQAGLQEVLHLAGAEVVLHGHAHEAVVSSTPGPRGPIPVLGVPSASAIPDGRHAPARWHMVEIDTEDGAARIIARGFAPHSDQIEELGRYGLSTLQG